MAKVDALQVFDDITMRRKQIVYLASYGFSPKEIQKYCNYAINTIRVYIYKFADLLEEAKECFKHITVKVKEKLLGGKQLVYLFKFYNSKGDIICSKVGTTTRTIERRLKEEVKYYRDHGLDVADWTVCSVIDCGELPAEGAESITRAEFIRKYPNAFHKNDRFFDVDISVNQFNKIVKEYLKGQEQ